MFTLALIGVIGGLISGISSCILPVLPVIFYSGAQSSVDDVATPRQSSSAVATAVNTKRVPPQTLRPYRVIGGLVCSFSVVALAGSALLSLLHLPQDTLRWIALVALAAIGFGLIFPMVEQLLERPFSGVPKKHIPIRTNGFGLGLALGVLYVPCAGPVLATIVVAGASAPNIGSGVHF